MTDEQFAEGEARRQIPQLDSRPDAQGVSDEAAYSFTFEELGRDYVKVPRDAFDALRRIADRQLIQPAGVSDEDVKQACAIYYAERESGVNRAPVLRRILADFLARRSSRTPDAGRETREQGVASAAGNLARIPADADMIAAFLAAEHDIIAAVRLYEGIDANGGGPWDARIARLTKLLHASRAAARATTPRAPTEEA